VWYDTNQQYPQPEPDKHSIDFFELTGDKRVKSTLGIVSLYSQHSGKHSSEDRK
jgi:hypothetical protein